MTNYNLVHVGPNNWFDYKADAFFGFMVALQQLGLNVEFSNNRFATDRTNIVVGSDWLVRGYPVNILQKRNIDYILVEGEFIDNATLNNRPDINFELYVEYLQGAKSVLTSYRHNIDELSKIGIEAQYYRWGDFPGRYNQIENTKKYHISSYYGLMKGQRKETFDALNMRLNNSIFLASTEDPIRYKEYCLNFSHSILSLKNAKKEFVNPVRIVEAMANGIPVFHNHKYDLDGYTQFCEIIPDLECVNPELFIRSEQHKKQLAEFAKSKQLIDSLRNCKF
jgi:hypothetical protein